MEAVYQHKIDLEACTEEPPQEERFLEPEEQHIPVDTVQELCYDHPQSCVPPSQHDDTVQTESIHTEFELPLLQHVDTVLNEMPSVLLEP